MFSENRLDDVDLGLLQALQENAKATLQELGKRVGLKPPAVMERVRKLETVGFIKGYHAHLDARMLGMDITAFIGVTIDYPGEIDDFLELLEHEGQVQECHHVTGHHTLMLKVRARNTEALEQLIRKVRERPGVRGSETMVVLSTWSEGSNLPLENIPIDDRRRGRMRTVDGVRRGLRH